MPRRLVYSCSFKGCLCEVAFPAEDRYPPGWYQVTFQVGREATTLDVCPAHAAALLEQVGVEPVTPTTKGGR